MRHSRKVLKVSGLDRQKFLNDLLTIEVGEELRYGALLTPQGKIVTDLFLWGEGEDYFLDLPEADYAVIKTKLLMYRLRSKVEFEDTSISAFQSYDGSPDPRDSRLGARVYTSPISDMSEEDYLKRRIEAKVAEFNVDYQTNEAYPIEWRFNEMKAISYQKGCYVGQEVAARMRHKTELQKSLVRVRFEGELAALTEMTCEGKPAGQLLSVYGQSGLAFLRLRYIEGPLIAGGIDLTLDELFEHG